MTKWIVLGGALLLGLALVAVAGVYPAALGGFSGLVIWMFLGYCGIIIVAQVCVALRDLQALARRQAALRSETKLQRVPAGGKQ